jgi:hypothetical protein
VTEEQARDELRFRLNIALGQFVEAAHDAVELARFEQVGSRGAAEGVAGSTPPTAGARACVTAVADRCAPGRCCACTAAGL